MVVSLFANRKFSICSKMMQRFGSKRRCGVWWRRGNCAPIVIRVSGKAWIRFEINRCLKKSGLLEKHRGRFGRIKRKAGFPLNF